MKFLLAQIMVLGIFSLANVAQAEGLKIKPGNWEFRSTLSAGGQSSPGEHVNVECLEDENLTPKTMMKNMQQGCEVIKSDSDGQRLSWQVSCTNPAGTSSGAGEVEVIGESMTGSMTMSLALNDQKMTMDMTWRGKYLGPCN